MVPGECLEYTSVFMAVKFSHVVVLIVGLIIGAIYDRIGK